jgi:F-type H+-transporting ATPase subunit b
MAIDFWGLGLQAINVTILIWLLSRVFWRPVAAAIANRQEAAKAAMETAHATQAEADAAVAEVAQARAGIAAERTAVLDAARKDADAASMKAVSEANNKADAILATAKITIRNDTEDARKANATHASDLSLKIAAWLLEQLNGPAAQSAFLSQLVDAIRKLPTADRAALVAVPTGMEIVTAANAGMELENIVAAVQTALGGTPDLKFVTDPNLIGGLELQNSHFVLHNSWQADLSRVQKAVKHAT